RAGGFAWLSSRRCNLLARQADHLAGFRGGRGLKPEVTNNSHNAIDLLDVRRELAARIVEIVFEADPHMAAHQDRLNAGIKLRGSDGADVEDRVLWHHVDHLGQYLRRVWHGPLKSTVCRKHEIDEIGWLVEARVDAVGHVLQEMRRTEHLPLGLD